MLMDGVQLMVIGMSVVFMFLVFLVIMMSGVTAIARVIEPAAPVPVATGTSGTSSAPSPAPVATAVGQPHDATAKIAAVLAIIAAGRNNNS